MPSNWPIRLQWLIARAEFEGWLDGHGQPDYDMSTLQVGQVKAKASLSTKVHIVCLFLSIQRRCAAGGGAFQSSSSSNFMTIGIATVSQIAYQLVNAFPCDTMRQF